jgi:hypothetical protein
MGTDVKKNVIVMVTRFSNLPWRGRSLQGRVKRDRLTGGLLQRQNGLGRIEPERFRKLKEFHNVNAALAAFEPGDEGLVFPEASGKIGLRHTRRLALGDEELDQSLVAFRSECLCQTEPRLLTAGSRSNLFYRLS